MKHLFYYILSTSLIYLTACSPTDKKQVTDENDSTVYNMVKTHQLLLTNSAEFKDHTGLYGASAFLIEYQDKTYALTAKHLIGQAGGVEPEINPQDLSTCINQWKMFPRIPVNAITDTVCIGKEYINYEHLKNDILILPVKNNTFHILSLKPSFNYPKKGDILFIIGCPYVEENCKQNIYAVEFDSYDDETNSLIMISKNGFNIAGFSGAPLLDLHGNAIGVVTAGGEQDGVYYIVATSIKAIKKTMDA